MPLQLDLIKHIILQMLFCHVYFDLGALITWGILGLLVFVLLMTTGSSSDRKETVRYLLRKPHLESGLPRTRALIIIAVILLAIVVEFILLLA